MIRPLAGEFNVHLGTPALIDFFQRYRSDEHLVLATISATEGSTYRKPGAMLLVSRDGEFEGLISGGCLESDLLQHAAAVFESGIPAQITYDMSAGDDLVWNLGLGCDGVIHLLLQRLETGRGWEEFPQIRASHRNRKAGVLASVVNSAAPGL